MKSERVKTGIKNFDKLVKGFRKNSVNLIAGGAGSGKTIFGLQFLMEGLKDGEGAIYLTFDGKREEVYADMLTIGLDFEKYEKKGRFAFIETPPEQVKRWINEGGGEIEEIINDVKATRIVVDNIESFALLYPNELAKKEAAISLFGILKGLGCTSVITVEALEGDGPSTHLELETEVDSIILLYHIREKGVRKRGIEFLKMRGTKTPEKTLALEITPKGLQINLKKTLEL